MLKSIESIKKTISKKQFEIKQALDDLQVKETQENILKVLRLCVDSKQVKLIELALFDIKNMEYDGNQIIDGKRMIEHLLDIVLANSTSGEETIQMHMIKALQQLMTNKYSHINQNVTKVFDVLINLHSVSRIQAISEACKDACQKIVTTYFVRLEDFGTLTQQEYSEYCLKNGILETYHKPRAQIQVEEYMRRVMVQLVDQVQIDIETKCLNEYGKENGKFGWCIVCRNTAQSYCKDTKVPVCSKECKTIHLNQMMLISVAQASPDLYVKDAFEIFEMLCQLSQREPQNPQLAPMALKCKILSLELIYEALAQGDVIIQKPQFIQLLKSQLLDSLLKNTLSQERQLLIMTLNIFVQIVWKFRNSMKKEIQGFIENVYFKFLDSSNSQYDHKQYTLKVFNKILMKPKVVLEIFVNYDCSIGQNNLLKKILEQQCKIVQGRYLKPEYASSITPQQEAHLKKLCVENFCEMIKSLRQYSDIPEPQREVQQAEEMADDEIQDKRQMKQQLDRAVQKFNFKPERCIQHLIACQYMPNKDAKIFSQFLWENRDVNKDKLGEYFGSEHEFNQSVFSNYVDFMNFKDQQIDEGLRNLLEYFTLPVESQQIDRIVQKFASKYVQDNSDQFSSAEAAYTLSYLLMMLQTDLHNPLNTEKMTEKQFINLARGINDGQDLPQEMLLGYYARIAKQPLAVHQKEQARRALELAQVDSRKRLILLAKEAESSLRKWIKEHQNTDDYYYVNTLDHIKPLLEQIWSPIFASLTVALEQTDNPKQIQDCFEGLGSCVRLLGKFDLDEEKDTFIFFLQKYFAPNIPSSIKQIFGVQCILQVATHSGQYLRKSWRIVLQLISRLELLHSAIKKVKVDYERQQQYTQDEVQQIEKLFSQIDYGLLDKIFYLSPNLDSDSILEFISALCELSKGEIKQNRKFMLSKVIEVADYNMGRIKIIWSKMWEIMREHLLEVGCGKQIDLAVYAIEQLKQLSLKFLQQQELANYNFQREFLLPFEQIFNQTQKQQREYILQCVSMIMNQCYGNIKSGWKIIMNVINQALQEDQTLVPLCVQITDKIMSGNLEAASEIYMDLISALIKLTKNKDLSIALKGIDQLKELINFIDRKKSNDKFLDCKPLHQIEIWIPVLSSLSILYSDERPEVSSASVRTLFQLLKEHGQGQTTEFWKMILRGVIRPLFDEIQFTKLQKQKQKTSTEVIYLSCQRMFELLTQLVIQQIESLQPCINDLIEIYVQFILQTQDSIAILCLESLKQIIEFAGVALHPENWTNIIEQITHILNQCAPKELFEAINLDEDFSKNLDQLIQEEPKQKKFSFKINVQDCYNKQSIQEKSLEILVLQIEKYKQSLNGYNNQTLLYLFQEQYQKTKKFNQSIYMRYFLQKQCDYGNDLPGFLIVEFISAKSLAYLLEGEELAQFIDQFVQRCTMAQQDTTKPFQTKDDLASVLEQLRYQESRQVVDRSYKLLQQHIFQRFQNLDKKIISKWLIDLLKGGLDCNVENKQYLKQLVELLELAIN